MIHLGYLGPLAMLLSWTTALTQTANGPATPVSPSTSVQLPTALPAPGPSFITSSQTTNPSPPLPAASPRPEAPPAEAPGGPVGDASAAPEVIWEGPSAPAERLWVSGEYLLWWIHDSRLPPLVTAGPVGSAGILGQPGTSVLFGGRTDNEERSAARFQAGYWLDDQRTVGVEGSYFFLGSRSVNFTAGGPGAGSTVIARPFVNALTGAEDSELVNAPGTLTGTVGASLSSRLQGAELNGVCNLCCGCNGRLDLLAGFRYLDLREGLGIVEDLASAPGVPVVGGTGFLVQDQFNTQNRFYGGQFGARAELRRGDFFVNFLGKVALGATHEVLDVAGSTVIAPPGQAATVANGGLLAVPSNSGHFTRDQFAVVPEVGINVGYQLTAHLRAFVGYSLIYWSNVVRPGDQVDRTVNPTQLPVSAATPQLIGAARPAPQFHETDFWAQGISFGLQFRY